MPTVICLFDERTEAMRASDALLSGGFRSAELDILTNDDQDDVPKLARRDDSVPLAGVTDMPQRLPSLPSNRAFVVQFRLPSEGKPMVWEGRVEHVLSGQAQRFESQEQLWVFITRVLTALQSRPHPGTAQDME
jgi:hypothetical protein